MTRAARATLTLLAVVGLLSASAAQAGEFGMSSGYFAPYSGTTENGGWLLNMFLLTSDPGSKWRWGGELEYRQYDSEILDVPNIKTQDVLLDVVVHWRPWPGKITPYLGLGGGMGVTIIDKDKLRDNSEEVTNFTTNKVGFMLGALGVAGIEVPLGSHLAFFAEGRGNIWARLNTNEVTDYRDTSGWDARGGIKLLY